LVNNYYYDITKTLKGQFRQKLIIPMVSFLTANTLVLFEDYNFGKLDCRRALKSQSKSQEINILKCCYWSL
jgi:hypothetical protein